jgi:OHCU decarboxylase
MHLNTFNKLNKNVAKSELLKCCGSEKWVDLMVQYLPFVSEKDLHNKATQIWFAQCHKPDWLEAFGHHPKIGELDIEKKFSSTKDWAKTEQAGVQTNNITVIEKLAKRNYEYEKKFGFIFIVCATGKSAEEMLQLIDERLLNDYDEEIKIAREEQNKITQLRLKKLLS